MRKRVFEGASGSSLSGGETQDERTFLHYFRHILENERFRNPSFVGWDAVRREKERLRQVQQAGAMAGGSVPLPLPAAGSGDGLVDGATPCSALTRVRDGSSDDHEEAGNREKDGKDDEMVDVAEEIDEKPPADRKLSNGKEEEGKEQDDGNESLEEVQKGPP